MRLVTPHWRNRSEPTAAKVGSIEQLSATPRQFGRQGSTEWKFSRRLRSRATQILKNDSGVGKLIGDPQICDRGAGAKFVVCIHRWLHLAKSTESRWHRCRNLLKSTQADGKLVMPAKRLCNGVSRRISSILELRARWHRSQSSNNPSGSRTCRESQRATRDVSLIFLFLHGGLSTIDSFDLKPDAPAEFRGEFNPIQTNVSGIRSANIYRGSLDNRTSSRSSARSASQLRSWPSRSLHADGLLSASRIQSELVAEQSASGSRLHHRSQARSARGVPPYVCLPRLHPSCGSAYLGTTVSPFVIDADPNAPNFSVPDIVPPPALATNRLENRRELLRQLDRFQESAERQANTHARAVSDYQREAFNLMVSPDARRAFDLQAEPARLRDEYGRHTLGQSCLMARRLVEAGVRCVTIDHSNWDTHDNSLLTFAANSCRQPIVVSPRSSRDRGQGSLQTRSSSSPAARPHTAHQPQRGPRSLGPAFTVRQRRQRAGDRVVSSMRVPTSRE